MMRLAEQGPVLHSLMPYPRGEEEEEEEASTRFVTWAQLYLTRLGVDELYAPYLANLCEWDTAEAVEDFLASLQPPWAMRGGDADNSEVRAWRT